MQPRRAPLLPRLWLSFILLLQVFATPFVAFSLTYLLQFEWNDAQASLQFRFDMMPWITAASLSYGMLAFLLAAVFGDGAPFRWLNAAAGLRPWASHAHRVKRPHPKRTP